MMEGIAGYKNGVWRTAEGRSRAKGRGQHMGRPPSLSPSSSRRRPSSAARRVLPSKELAESYNVGLATIFRLGRAEV